MDKLLGEGLGVFRLPPGPERLLEGNQLLA
jgi:hypothetical protein